MPVVEESTHSCSTCGDTLVPGPLGPQCPRCLFAFAAVEGDDTEQLAALFPELRIERKIARGGFGTVFRAEHRRMHRPVALKFLDGHLAWSPEAVALFEREMIHAGSLDHPGIVRAYDAGEREGHWFIVMELIDGVDCGALVRRHRTLPLAESCEIIRRAALALHYAHGQGLVHRDVKPGNIMLTHAPEPAVKVLDFGLAGIAVAPLFSDSGDLFLGTLEYMSPEQIEAPNRVDARADVYALGATLRRMLTGQPLREGGGEHSLFQRMKVITSEPATPLVKLRPDLPAKFTRLCDRLVAIDPAARPATAAELARLLTPWCAGEELARLFTDGPHAEKPFVIPEKPRRPRWVTAALLFAVVATVIAAFVIRERGKPRPVPATSKAKAVPTGPWRSLVSAELMQIRSLELDHAPRLYSAEWEPEGEIFSTNELFSPRFLPDGRIAHVRHDANGSTLSAQAVNEKKARIVIPASATEKPRFLAVSQDGFFAWSRPDDPDSRHIGRARPDGSLLPIIPYDLSQEYHQAAAALRLAGTERDPGPQGYPWGLASVLPGQVPENSGLQAGDILIADEGHRSIIEPLEVPPGLWRCRFDSDAPAIRLGALSGERHLPMDVAVSRHGVFLLNRSETIPSAPLSSDDHDRRLYRWDQEGFHSCYLEQPLYDPAALAADPLSADLYALQGALIPSASLTIQRLLRLRPIGPDRYKLEVVADRFGKLSASGLAFSADGQRIAICDVGNRVIVVLKRRTAAAPPSVGAK